MSDKHLRVWFVVFVVAVFIAGIGSGVIVDRYVGRPGRPPVPPPMRARHALMSQLNLTADQQKQLDRIFEDRQKRIREIQSENFARFDSEQREFRDEIEKILTPEQRKRFEDWLAREPVPGIRSMRGRGMGPGRGLGPGGGMGPGRGRGPGL